MDFRERTSDLVLDFHLLEASHEEADTRLVLHCMHTNAESVVVSVRDTDILVLLPAHFHNLNCKKIWMKAGISKHRKYIPLHDIRQNLSFSNAVFETLIQFHAIRSCDTVSYFAGHGKKTTWKFSTTDSHLPKDLGKRELTQDTKKGAEKFVCKLYNVRELSSCDNARVLLPMQISRSPIPPTTDALRFHVQRAHYQSIVWRQAINPQPVLPSPATMGWGIEDGKLSPKLMSLPPIPESSKDIV